MDPTTQWLKDSPRDAYFDAFFRIDRSTVKVDRIAELRTLKSPHAKGPPTLFEGFEPRHDLRRILTDNPFRHARKTGLGAKGVIDSVVAKYGSEAMYTCFLSAAARKLVDRSAARDYLRIVVFWGTGSQCTRHGVAGAVENAELPTLLINISGVETTTPIKFTDPDDPFKTVTLVSNNVWPVACTNELVERAIIKFYGRLIDYRIDTLAAFSTGYLGLQESVNSGVIRIDHLKRVVFYDCLYGSLRTSLHRIQALRSGVQIVAYVATGYGNSFVDPKAPTMRTLALKDLPGCNYINLIYCAEFNAIASAHIINEALAAPYPILDTLPANYLHALDALNAVLPERLAVMSDEGIFRTIRGAPPAGAISLTAFMAIPAHAEAVRNFHKQVATTERCLYHAQLMGWPMPPGEEWHDLIPAEFAWEYLS